MKKASGRSLRKRSTIGFALLGTLLSLCFAAAIRFIAEDYEHVVVTEILGSVAEDYEAQIARDAAAARSPQMLLGRRLQVYLLRPGHTDDVPSTIVDLPLGIHEPEDVPGDGIHIGVFDTEGGRVFVVIDLQDIEVQEHYLDVVALLIILGGATASTWLGWGISGRVISPVKQLLLAVSDLPTEPQPTQLERATHHDELRALARALDEYQERLADNDKRMQRFFADASHELRTPLTVIKGGIDLLVDDTLPPHTAETLERVERGVAALTDLLEALLLTARRTYGAETIVHAEDWVEQTLHSLGDALMRRREFVLISDVPRLALRPRESGIILRSLIRSVTRGSDHGTLSIHVGRMTIDVSYLAGDGPTSGGQLSGAGSDVRLGITTIERLASQIGWRILTISSTAVRIEFH